jgi:vitellogenic carboxypeptidase-like protein
MIPVTLLFFFSFFFFFSPSLTSLADQGQKMSLVQGIPADVLSTSSWSGYFELSPGRKTFFWFFEAENKDPNAPVVTWLQGGPGGSSMYGLFFEHGPFSVSVNGTLQKRKYAWTNTMAMLYIDNPIGCGFSYTTSPNGFVTNEDEVGRDLYNFQTQFFKIFYQYQKNPFFIAGESYGGA